LLLSAWLAKYKFTQLAHFDIIRYHFITNTHNPQTLKKDNKGLKTFIILWFNYLFYWKQRLKWLVTIQCRLFFYWW